MKLKPYNAMTITIKMMIVGAIAVSEYDTPNMKVESESRTDDWMIQSVVSENAAPNRILILGTGVENNGSRVPLNCSHLKLLPIAHILLSKNMNTNHPITENWI